MTTNVSDYIKLLPVSFTHNGEQLNKDLANYLRIFENILSSPIIHHEQDQARTPIISFGRMIDDVQNYSDPDAIPLDIFPDLGSWISSCLGVIAQQDWSYFQLKQMIKQIVPIYRIRTTKSGMEALFSILTEAPAEVIELLGTFGIGFKRNIDLTSNDNDQQSSPDLNAIQMCSGRLGTVKGQSTKNNMILGGKMTGNFFIINLTISGQYSGEKRIRSIFNRVLNLLQWINQEKPIQTQFQLNYTTTPLRIGARGSCTVGLNTSLIPDSTTRTINSWQNYYLVLQQQLLTSPDSQPQGASST